MSGGWSRYTRGAASGSGTGCWSAIVMAIITIGLLAIIGSLVLPAPPWETERNQQL